MKVVGGKFDSKIANKNVENLSKLQKSLSSLIIINCWHFNSNESDAMWQLYLKDNEGISIQTSLRNFKECFSATSHEVNAGKIRYLNYEKDIYYDKNEFPIKAYNAKTPLIHKRNHYKHEQEFRALIELEIDSGFKYDWDNEEFRKGKMISIDVNTLIEKVIIPPNSEKKYIEKVKRIISAYGFDFPGEKSEMNIEPHF